MAQGWWALSNRVQIALRTTGPGPLALTRCGLRSVRHLSRRDDRRTPDAITIALATSGVLPTHQAIRSRLAAAHPFVASASI